MAIASKGHIRRRGNQYEVAVCRGREAATQRYRYLYGYAPTYADAERERDRLAVRVAAGYRTDPKVTVGGLLEHWPSVAEPADGDVDDGDVDIEAAIRRTIGDLPLHWLQHRVDVLDLLYAHLRRCDQPCDGRRRVDHRTAKRHRCDHRCRPHECQTMPRATIRQLHDLLQAVFAVAVSWGWMDRNPAKDATPPRLHP